MSCEKSPEDITIPVPWGQITGKWWGPRHKQPILALHGWQDNSGSFDNLIQTFPSDVSILCIDFPGHGKSSHYPKGQFYYLFWDGLILVRRIVKYYNWTKITIIGHSLGGAVGFLYAGTFPEDIEKLISIDIASPTIHEPSKIVSTTGPSIDKFLQYDDFTEENAPLYSYSDIFSLVIDAYKGSLTHSSCEVLLKRGVRKPNSSEDKFTFTRDVRLKVGGLGALSLDLALEYASKIKCEYLNIRAVPGLLYSKLEYYRAVVDQIKQNAKRFEFIEMEGSHHIHMNNPEKISPIIIQFLNSESL